MIRFPNIALLVFLWCVPTLAMGEVNITGGTQAPQYTCTDEVGQTPTHLQVLRLCGLQKTQK